MHLKKLSAGKHHEQGKGKRTLMLKSGKKSLGFDSRLINNLLFPKISPVHESNSVPPSTVHKQMLQISTKIKQYSILSKELKVGHV